MMTSLVQFKKYRIVNGSRDWPKGFVPITVEQISHVFWLVYMAFIQDLLNCWRIVTEITWMHSPGVRSKNWWEEWWGCLVASWVCFLHACLQHTSTSCRRKASKLIIWAYSYRIQEVWLKCGLICDSILYFAASMMKRRITPAIHDGQSILVLVVHV